MPVLTLAVLTLAAAGAAPQAAAQAAPVAVVAVVADTPVARPRAIQVDEGYERRLRVHRWLAYSLPVVFTAQAIAGQRIFEHGDAAPAWAWTTHRVGAFAVGTIFVANTVTGAMNLHDSRGAPGGTRRVLHAAGMLVAAGGFAYAGAVLAERAESDPAARRQHRAVAIGSMTLTLANAAAMRFLGDE